MKNSHLKTFAVVAAMALLVAATAVAKRPDHAGKPDKAGKTEKRGKGKGKKQTVKLVTGNVKGEVVSNDGSTMAVLVEKASGHVKACKGMTLTFDVSEARVHSADNDTNPDIDANDVLVGHKVKVRAKVLLTKGRKTSCSVAENEMLTAKAVHNRTTPKVDDEVDETEVEEPEVEEGTDEV